MDVIKLPPNSPNRVQEIQQYIGESILFDKVGRLLDEIEHVKCQFTCLDLPIPTGCFREAKNQVYTAYEALGQRFEDARKKDKAA